MSPTKKIEDRMLLATADMLNIYQCIQTEINSIAFTQYYQASATAQPWKQLE